jgi:hypothetical protein
MAVPEGRCCNGWGCTPGTLHGIVTTVPPIVHDVGAKPSQGTIAWFALQYLEKWCEEAAGNSEDYRDIVGQPPGSFVLRPQQQWLIAQQFSGVKEKGDWRLKTVSDLQKLIKPEQWTYSGQLEELEAELVQMLNDNVQKIIDDSQEGKKRKARRRDSSSSESSQDTDDSSALGRARSSARSQRLARDNAVARTTIQDKVDEQRDHERARAVRIGATEVIPIIDDVPDGGSYLERGPITPATRTPVPNQPMAIRSRRELNPSTPETPIRHRNEGKRPTSNVEPPETPEAPVLQLRRPSVVVEGKEGRGARRIKYTAQFQSIMNKRSL